MAKNLYNGKKKKKVQVASRRSAVAIYLSAVNFIRQISVYNFNRNIYNLIW